ncbi:unnamed protein product [Soboliphyme baturini]|uniref:RRM domain-containing protein n=1 Tax=Soboliphyme baturini TaxID=241478 RepID=A0A183J7A9_9BILA|nr:unnamed protein product [Soboliphyme baturini]
MSNLTTLIQPGVSPNVDKSQRLVFVANIPFESTEEELKALFSQMGPLVAFRLAVDRETGRSKGYGVCEFIDQEAALSALRNLNGFDLRGQLLRLDLVVGQRHKEELRQLQGSLEGPSPESSSCPSQKAPEAISRAVASLPPEQMFELMKQMKICIQNNPNEARNMLLKNPQLAYALLQAQVVMRIVDPQLAMSIVSRDPTVTVPPSRPPTSMNSASDGGGSSPTLSTTVLPALSAFPPTMPVTAMPIASSGVLPVAGPIVGPKSDVDYRKMPVPAPVVYPPFVAPRVPIPTIGDFASRSRGPILPNVPVAAAQAPSHAPLTMVPPSHSNVPASAEDQEKAALIMQVLQLTDEQIAMLPADQKQSVLLLREQFRTSEPR